MHASQFKPAAATALALSALLALGACGKKVEDTGATPSGSSPSTSSSPSTPSPSSGTSPMPTPEASAAVSNSGSTAPGTPASGSTK